MAALFLCLMVKFISLFQDTEDIRTVFSGTFYSLNNFNVCIEGGPSNTAKRVSITFSKE